MLGLLLKKTQEYFFNKGQCYLAHLYTALFSTAYFGLFRVGELADSQHSIKACDVHIGENKNKILFILHSSKTHNKGDNPQQIKNTSSPTSHQSKKCTVHFCPYDIIRRYLGCRKGYLNDVENFFVFRDRAPVPINNFNNTLKKIVELSSFDNMYYSSHSFRAGRSVDLMKIGLSVETIKKMGRWKSNAVYAYLK